MAIKNFPHVIYKTVVPAIDRVMARRSPVSVSTSSNLASASIDNTVSCDGTWQIDSVSFAFSNASARDFSVAVKNGRKVVAKYNDSLWFWVDGIMPQQIFLREGFYTGTQLATELQSRLNANAAFTAASKTFTVAYDSGTGVYTVTPSSGTIKYLEQNTQAWLSIRQSTGGHLMGFNVSTANFSANVSSDTTVASLDSENAIISRPADTSLSYYNDDSHTLSIDQALRVQANSTSSVTASYVVVYEKL